MDASGKAGQDVISSRVDPVPLSPVDPLFVLCCVVVGERKEKERDRKGMSGRGRCGLLF